MQEKVSHTKEYRKGRQNKILEIIGLNKINTQEQLAAKLNECGYEVTQATLSRDIKELRLTKISEGKERSYYSALSAIDIDKGNKYVAVLREGYDSSEKAMNILVIRTVSGLAMAVAAALDSMNLKELVGCVAGDDTVLCVTHSPEETDILDIELKRLLN